MRTKFQNLQQDSITLHKNKGNRKKDPKEDWSCAPGFCTVGRCYPPDCYKEILRTLSFPRECDPGMCTPGKCNPKKCAEILLRNSRAAHKFSSVESAYEIKSKPSVVDKVKSVQKDIVRCFCTLDLKKNLQKEPKPHESKSVASISTQSAKPLPKIQTRTIRRRRVRRRLVRISSSFTFDIEFIRENNPGTEKTIEPLKESERCYCALELHEAAKEKMKSKSSVTHQSLDHVKVLSNAYTNPNTVHKNTASTSVTGSSSAGTHKSESKKNQKKVKRCFCTKDYFEKKKKKEGPEGKKKENPESKVTQTKKKNNKHKELLPYECEPHFCIPGKCNPVKCEERIQQRPKKQYHSLVHKCLCTLNLDIKLKQIIPNIEKPKKVKTKTVKLDPIEGKTTETQTIKVKPKKVTKPKEPKKPKKKRNTYCYPSGYRDSYNSLGSDLQPCKTKKRNQKCGCLDSGDSQPSQSLVRLSSGVSFNIEFSKDYGKTENPNEDGHGRGDFPNTPLGINLNLSGQLMKRTETTPIK